MSFLLQTLPASHRQPKKQEMKLPIVAQIPPPQLISWEGGRILPGTGKPEWGLLKET